MMPGLSPPPPSLGTRSISTGLSHNCALRAGQFPTTIYKQTGNPRAVQVLLGRRKIESTVRHLGVGTEDALALAEGTAV
jgi:hypothetical protein